MTNSVLQAVALGTLCLIYAVKGATPLAILFMDRVLPWIMSGAARAL